MQVWNVLYAARWNTGRKKSPKNRHLGTIAQLYRALSSQLRHVSTIRKQEGQHPLTARHAAIFRRDLEETYDFNWWLLGKPVSNCMFAAIKMELSGKSVYGPVLKTTQLSARAQNHASPEHCRISFTIIFLGHHDNRFKFWQSDSI